MTGFNHHQPTILHFGAGEINNIGQVVAQWGEADALLSLNLYFRL